MISHLTPSQRLSLTAGASMWATVGYPEGGIPSLKMADGPMGVASGRIDERDISFLTPCPTALGASWDDALCRRVGALVGSDAARKGVDLVLAPNVNLARSPLAGRSFEYFSEDPLLAGLLGAAWAGGVQTAGVGAVAKHLVCNDSETARDRMNVVVDERTLREVYLLPFELCAEAGVAGMLTSYNRVNGDWCAEQRHVLSVAKQEWGFPGLFMSDWFATHSTSKTLNAGLDLEMPGPARFLGLQATTAVETGEVPQARVDDAASRVASVARRFAGEKAPSMAEADAEALLIEAAAAGFVLLRNEGSLLPLVPGRDQRIAVIGPNAAAPCYQGGTFAKISVSPSALRPLEAIRARYGEHAQVSYEPGVDPQPRLPSMPVRPARDLGDGCSRGMTLDYFSGQGEYAPLRASETRDCNSLVWFAGIHDDTATLDRPARIVARGLFDVERSGTYNFYLGATGPVRMLIDGREVLAQSDRVPANDVMGRLKSGEAESIGVELAAGRSVIVEIEFIYDAARVQGLWYGVRSPDSPEAMLARAVDLARQSDAVFLIVGETSDSSVESKDRRDTLLAPEQLRLIEEVTAANPRTAVIANVGHAIDTHWDERAAALMIVWYPGEGFGAALAEVLAGDREPGGRMPVSITRKETDYPAFALDPEPNDDLPYYEGTRLGYRGISDPRHAFGSGLGYGAIELIAAAAAPANNAGIVVTVEVANLSDRDGAEVLQVYRRSPELALVGFSKVRLAAGEQKAVEIAIPRRRMQLWQDGWTDIAEPDLFVGRSAMDARFDLLLDGERADTSSPEARGQ